MIRILGILNLTPDSFYAPSRTAPGDVVSAAREMLADGAWGVDLGAVSTRPGSTPVSLEEEWGRLEPSLVALRDLGCVLSVDTFRSTIVSRVYDTVGQFIVNDITAGAYDPGMLSVVGRLGLPYIAMHMHGSPFAPSETPGDIVEDVLAYFQEFSLRASYAGISQWYLDPGFGFSKTLDQNWELLHRLGEIAEHSFPCTQRSDTSSQTETANPAIPSALKRPVLVGISRKSMLWKRFGITPEEALPATSAAHLIALQQGASVLRVHDVAEASRTVAIFNGL